ncbi:predicted protein [Chaetomium globosum CBS 148.51]|uniref:Uncharacterized protein n=1 Tax=Chaetomium globosum (strain ATCC 6205 / CBS 148.51 / DSM 1962 / NBRC 6347 / NRRL 1970) TaxID=306901 RepID=Q2H2F9_CHAGB|nr:uncharacterized protein CHGG_04037 [Chaetomium globosum CBS 148.51]EAQ87418.1 predicted protein [Chaetomium globosum CBS 148.51]
MAQGNCQFAATSDDNGAHSPIRRPSSQIRSSLFSYASISEHALSCLGDLKGDSVTFFAHRDEARPFSPSFMSLMTVTAEPSDMRTALGRRGAGGAGGPSRHGLASSPTSAGRSHSSPREDFNGFCVPKALDSSESSLRLLDISM